MDVAPGGWWYAAAVLAVGVAVTLAFAPLGLLALAGAVGAVCFHRDPPRTVGDGVVAPADGRVSVVRDEGDRLRVGIYMSALDVHVNRAPLGGRVTRITRREGGHRPAFRKDSDRNERVRVDFEAPEYAVELVAGAVARRIHPYPSPGEGVERGDRIGHISFGSRADVILPSGVDRGDLAVEVGDRVRAGATTVARVDDGDAEGAGGGR
jgi:phosphatidylserine decarboxylase